MFDEAVTTVVDAIAMLAVATGTSIMIGWGWRIGVAVAAGGLMLGVLSAVVTRLNSREPEL
jgi:hypothetical protein